MSEGRSEGGSVAERYSHAEWRPPKVTNRLLCNTMKVWGLIVIRRVIVVGQLDEEVALA